MSPRRSFTKLSPVITSSDAQNSSLFAEIHDLTSNVQSSNNNFIYQTVTEAGSGGHFQHDQLSFIDDTLDQLRSIINSSPSNADEPSEFT